MGLQMGGWNVQQRNLGEKEKKSPSSFFPRGAKPELVDGGATGRGADWGTGGRQG